MEADENAGHDFDPDREMQPLWPITTGTVDSTAINATVLGAGDAQP